MEPVTVSVRGAAALRAGHPFVTRTEVVSPPQGGDVVLVRDPRGGGLGSALWAASGRIALRRLCPEGRALDEALLKERIAAAARRRQVLAKGPLGGIPDAYRVVHGEADGLPGLIVDRYAGAAVIQTMTAAMDAREGLIARVVAAVLGCELVVARDDGSARDLEGLARRRGVLLPVGSAGEAQTLVRYHDAGVLLEADLLTDGKTGGFLDQQENHALALGYAQTVAKAGGRTALDAFTYHGGFALALSRGGLETMACDENAVAIGRARRNAELNGLAVDFQVRNAFDLLRALEASGRRFDMVVIDPPALAKRGQAGASAVAAAVRAYKELNLRGLRLLSPGGLLITCSCSARVGGAEFGAMLEAAAHDAGAQVQVLERRGAGRDHPVLLGVPETEYLKCWVLRRA